MLLLVAMGGLAWEAIGRLLSGDVSVQEQGVTIMVVAGIGIVINTATALLFMRTRESDLNIRGAFLHMAAGALVPAGVVVPGTRGLFKQSLGHGHFAYCPHSGTGDATRPRERCVLAGCHPSNA